MRRLASLVCAFALGCGAAHGDPSPLATAHAAPAETHVDPAPPRAATAAPDSIPKTASVSGLTADRQAPPPASTVVPEPERVDVSPEVEAIVNAPERTAEDKALDVGRQPGQMLAFYSISPGLRVAELGAGNGYFTELLALAVAPNGKVFAQNSKAVTDRPASAAWTDRLKRPELANVVRVDRELESPLPPEATNLDAVFVEFFYHDLYWMNVDRAAMNKAIFNALKPGGTYAVVDHASKPGEGTTVVKTLHRIEESEVIRDVQSAGFALDGEATFLRNPRDTKDWSTVPSPGAEKRGTSDRFVLRFRKPK